jgi:hypothetical protein
VIKYSCFVLQKEVDAHECWVCFQRTMRTKYKSKVLCQEENAEKVDGDNF